MKKSSQDDNKQRNPTVRKILSDVASVSINWKERELVYITIPKSGNAIISLSENQISYNSETVFQKGNAYQFIKILR
ncbi:hypothetical protein DW776_16695 [Ruminococcus sp. AM30-15AC]|nr:hypothetical protein DWV90_21315 [Ruminococcus sp. AF13-37]RHD89408.1 hypothetical protein DW776_16695 [Ruminococcus sp. AM30-15AC]RHT47188.1 hypothetical protein DW768_18220 [Ruminococcus sp. AM29-26]